MKHKLAALMGGLFLAIPTADAAVTFTGGGADLTFYYDSAADSWTVVFRAKGTAGQPTSASATGLTSPFNSTSTPSTWTGIVGNQVPATPGDTGDYTFDTLQVNVTSAPLTTVNGNGYWITPASGTSYSNTAQPDLGIRTRLRENQIAMGIGTNTEANQFDGMTLTLDWANSLRPAGAEFIMFKYNALTETNDVLYETAANDLTHTWDNFGHTHWHFGFSDPGDYSLVFGIAGSGGTYGATASGSQVTVNFSVVPEPSAALLSILAAGVFGLRRRRK